MTAAVDPGGLVQLAGDAADELDHQEHEERVGGQELGQDQRDERVHPASLLNRMYCGTTTTWNGSMIVTSMIANHSVLSRNCSRANAYAASEQDEQVAGDRADHHDGAS